MKPVSQQQMRQIAGGYERGTACGFMVGATIGATFVFGPLAGALLYMFTPATCALDFGL